MFSVTDTLEFIKSQKTIAMLAPSFPVDFLYPDVVKQLRAVGFDKVVELTYSAKLINRAYRELLQSDPSLQIICTNCPTVTQYVARKYPQHRNKLANIASPMVMMSRIAKKTFGEEYKTIFIGPCMAKQFEAKTSGEIDIALTFKELKTLFDGFVFDKNLEVQHWGFDKFYNDYTKVYPLTGAVVETMHYRKLLEQHEYVVADGMPELDKALEEMEKNPKIRFVDALSCAGGCIGGPAVISQESVEIKAQKICEYRDSARQDGVACNFGKLEDMPEDLDFENSFLRKI